MPASPRSCAYCAAPLAGRADKVYCSPSCKSKDFRRQQAEAAGAGEAEEDGFRSATGEATGPRPRYSAVPLRSGQDEDEDEDAFEDGAEGNDEAAEAIGRRPAPAGPAPLSPEQFQQAVARAVAQHAVAQLPLQYAACIERVLAADTQALTGRDLERLAGQVAKTIAAYQPLATGPHQPAFVAAHLQDLCDVADVIEEAGAEWDEEEEPVALGLKKKFRAQLRTALALIARS
jgi:hypothetical protein